MSEKTKYPMYKGKPLVRCGDTIYYGSMKDKYVVKLEITVERESMEYNLGGNTILWFSMVLFR